MNQIREFVLIGIVSVFIISTAFAQEVQRQVIRGTGDVFVIQELGAILIGEQDTVTIRTLLPVDTRPRGYADIEVKKNDEILMVNAKRIKSAKMFEELYNAVDIGATVKMGIKRGDEMVMVAFAKIDPKELPKGRMIQLRVGTDGPGATIAASELKPLPGTGVILTSSENKVKVDAKIAGMALEQADIQTGDIILKLNGMTINSMVHFFELYEKIEIGGKVDLEYFRGEKKLSLSFKKPEAKGQVIM